MAGRRGTAISSQRRLLAGHLLPQLRREHIRYPVLDGVDFAAALAAELPRPDLPFCLLEYFQVQIALAERAGQNLHQIALHALVTIPIR